MAAFGYTLSSEEHPPSALVAGAQQAEASGFDLLSISDLYHPWVQAQGRSPCVWSMLGAIAGTTDVIPVGVGVTCPTVRIRPAVLAQAAATASLQFDGRFPSGVGTGNARLFNPPDTGFPVIVSAFGELAVDLATDIGDGFWGNAPDPNIIDRYGTGGGRGPRHAQVRMCWSGDADDALQPVREVWPNGVCGPGVGPVVASARQCVTAGYDHEHFHQIGPDQAGFFHFWKEELSSELADLEPVSSNAT